MPMPKEVAGIGRDGWHSTRNTEALATTTRGYRCRPGSGGLLHLAGRDRLLAPAGSGGTLCDEFSGAVRGAVGMYVSGTEWIGPVCRRFVWGTARGKCGHRAGDGGL